MREAKLRCDAIEYAQWKVHLSMDVESEKPKRGAVASGPEQLKAFGAALANRGG